MKIQNLKGFRDFLPEVARKRQWLIKKIKDVFEKWGFVPLETPTLEPLELFAGQIGEDEKLFFSFKDNGGRDVVMRYDQTVPVSRVIAQYRDKITFPFKRYQIQSAFRAEKPQKGRYREFLQCDADIFGVKSAQADAEVIAISLDIYRSIGFKNAKVLVNDRALLKDLPYEAVTAIDKIKKIGDEGVIDDMVKKGISKEQAEEYLKIVKDIKPNETIQTIFNYLKNYGFDQSWYEFDQTIARSFSYSSGPIWEVVVPEYTVGSTLGGERYDDLIKNISGFDVPATGFAVGFDRTLEAADQLGLIPESSEEAEVFVSIFKKEFLKESLKVASKLRDQGIACDIYPDAEKDFVKQIKYADKKGYEYVVIIGDDEVKNDEVTVKFMKTGEQEKVKREQVSEYVAKLVS